MKKRLWSGILLIALLFLVACKGGAPGDKPLDTEAAIQRVQTGTEGVKLSLVQNYPPNLLYDQNEFLALVEVKNKGNFDLDQRDCFVQITGADPNIIRGIDQPRSCGENLGVLEGKDIYNVEGSANQLEFRSAGIALPPNVFEYNPTLNIVACYTYRTTASPLVCIDPLFYQITSEQKACTPKDVSTGSGQGAPVGVSYVGVDMVGGRAIFEINIKNFGSGRVLSPFVSLQTCGSGSLDFTDIDRLRYSVRLGSTGLPGDCKPRDGFVRLTNEQGKIICSFDIPGTVAYETPLLVDLDYSYTESISKKVKIIRTPE